MTHLMSCGFAVSCAPTGATLPLSTLVIAVAAGATNVAKQSSSNN